MKNSSGKYWFLILWSVIGLINTLTMPYYFYAGDAVVQKTDGFNLLRSHQIGSDPKKLTSPRFDVSTTHPNQYFIYNSRTGRFVSRWGIPTSVIMALPEIFTFSYPKNSVTMQLSSILAHNIFNILLSILFASYIFYLSTIFAQAALSCSSSASSRHPSPRPQNIFLARLLGMILTLATCYASFTWNYLRAQSYDLWQLVLFTIFITHYAKAMAYLPGDKKDNDFPHLGIAVISLCILVLIKELYGLIFFVILLHLGRGPSKVPRKTYFWWIALGALLLVLIAVLNYWAYDTIFLGRSRLHHNPSSQEAFWGLQFFWPRLKDYLFSLNWSVWANFPLLIFAGCGFKAAYPHFKRFLQFILLCLGLFSIFFLGYYTRGEWCYGPRFYLFILPVLSLPAMFTFVRICTLPKKWAVPITIILLTGTGLNVYGQCLINEREFFTSYSMSSIWEMYQLKSKYFDERPRILVMDDLQRMFYHLEDNPLLRQIQAENLSYGQKLEMLNEMLKKYFSYHRNYRLWPDKRPANL
ncbi:MAG: hypothetical protein J6Y94_06455 [Bacteriovoracaceae bacterium]|nr:hypothetical protein [Bacteriovoracaceae bacterium]